MGIGTENKSIIISEQKYQPLVSIITPTYNHARYIEQCIKSVLSQSYTNWEHIIIDDGSTDATPQIVFRYTNDKRIHYIRQEHMGIWNLSKTYNKALSLARGELIAILEGDDFWPSDKLEKQIPFFKDPEVALTWGIGIYVNKEGRAIGRSPPPGFRCIEGRRAFRALLRRNFVTPTVTVMLRRDVLTKVGFVQPYGAPFVDYPTWFELIDKGKWCFINEVLGFWRVHSGQMTRNVWQM